MSTSDQTVTGVQSDTGPAHRYGAALAGQIESRWQTEWAERGTFEAPNPCLLYTSPSPRDKRQSRMPSSA